MSGLRRPAAALAMAVLTLPAAGCGLSGGSSGAGPMPTSTFEARGPGEVWSSGLNENGQLGRRVNELDVSLGPVTAPGGGTLADVTTVAAGGRHSIAVLSDGRVVSWGANDHGQLGDGTRRDSAVPVPVKAPDGRRRLTAAVAVAANSDFSMALLRNGTVVTWGEGAAGQRGIGRSAAPLLPTTVLRPDGRRPLTGVTAIAADGRTELVLLKNGSVLAWGANNYGMVGDGSTVKRALPVPVRGLRGERRLTGVSAISMGGQHALALLGDGRLVSWGLNDLGQLGHGSRSPSPVPKPVSGVKGKGELRDVAAISAAEKHNFALLRNGTAVAWGNNTAGQLGDGTLAVQPAPVPVVGAHGPLLRGVVQVHAGEAYGAAVLSDGSAMTWGSGSRGQLASGNRVSRNRPGPLIMSHGRSLRSVVGIGAGERHLLVLLKP